MMKTVVLRVIDTLAMVMFPLGALCVEVYYLSQSHFTRVLEFGGDSGRWVLLPPEYPTNLVCVLIAAGIVLHVVVAYLSLRWQDSSDYIPLLSRWTIRNRTRKNSDR